LKTKLLFHFRRILCVSDFGQALNLKLWTRKMTAVQGQLFGLSLVVFGSKLALFVVFRFVARLIVFSCFGKGFTLTSRKGPRLKFSLTFPGKFLAFLCVTVLYFIWTLLFKHLMLKFWLAYLFIVKNISCRSKWWRHKLLKNRGPLRSLLAGLNNWSVPILVCLDRF